MNEPGTVEQGPKRIDKLAQELIRSLPPEGIIFHGALNRDIPNIIKEGIKQGKNGRVDFFSFGPFGNNQDDLTKQELHKLIRQFRGTLQQNVFWSAVNSNFLNNGETVEEKDLPAIIVAKQQSNSKIPEYNLTEDHFIHEVSPNIPPDDLLLTVQLTLDEYLSALKRYNKSLETGKLTTRQNEIASILQGKVLKGLLNRRINQTAA